jgi:hypothetical protein
MRRIHPFIALGLLAIGLAGCGKFQKAQRAAWRDQAEAACMARREVPLSAYVSLRGKPIDGPGTCGMEQPLRVSAFSGGSIALTSQATLGCPIVSTTDRWLSEVVQPAAMNILGAQVIEIRAGSYSCRAMNNGSGTSRASEHSFGNAVDVFSFRLSDNRVVTVKNGWRGAPEEQSFLREVFVGACQMFSTVLGPGADAFHDDHFHIDLARHAKGRQICKPIIKYTPHYDLPPPDPARPYSSAQSPRQVPAPMTPAPMTPAPIAPAPVAREPVYAQNQPLLRQPAGGLRPPGVVQGGGYPVANYGHPGGGLEAQRRYLEEHRAAGPRGGYGPQPLSGEMRGPLALPGSVPPTEETMIGDEEGGVVDQRGSEEAQPITPGNDPFAYGGRGGRRN